MQAVFAGHQEVVHVEAVYVKPKETFRGKCNSLVYFRSEGIHFEVVSTLTAR